MNHIFVILICFLSIHPYARVKDIQTNALEIRLTSHGGELGLTNERYWGIMAKFTSTCMQIIDFPEISQLSITKMSR